MNRISFVFAVLAFATISLVPLSLQAQDKIVYIDSYRIRLEYKEFQDAQALFNKEVEQWNIEVEAGQKEIEQMEAELAKQALILSDAKKKEKEAEIETKKVAWQKLANDIFGPDGRAELRNVALTKPLLDKINSVLERVALIEGYDMILDSVNGNIAYAKKEMEITDKILEELEKTQ
ncbi:MAG: OmpH family outer membrane protein [bacterium]|nr:OmpH family outer membrane protein [bacterium]